MREDLQFFVDLFQFSRDIFKGHLYICINKTENCKYYENSGGTFFECKTFKEIITAQKMF